MPPVRTLPHAVRTGTPLDDIEDGMERGAGKSKARRIGKPKPRNDGLQLSSKTNTKPGMATPDLEDVPGAEHIDSDGDVPKNESQCYLNWVDMPYHTLRSMRAAYGLQIPSFYTRPHADFLYQSSDVAKRAPSQVRARWKSRDMYRLRNIHPEQTLKGPNANTSNGHWDAVKKKEYDARRDNRSAKRRKLKADALDDDHTSISTPEDIRDAAYITPLHKDHLETSIVERSFTPAAFGNVIRTHFGEGEFKTDEAEVIARFSYIVRTSEPKYNRAKHNAPLAQRFTGTKLPLTTAEKIAATAEAHAVAIKVDAGYEVYPSRNLKPAARPDDFTNGEDRPQPHDGFTRRKYMGGRAQYLAANRNIGRQEVEVEGSYGDGNGRVMGTTSCGREVKMTELSASGGFRKRFAAAKQKKFLHHWDLYRTYG